MSSFQWHRVEPHARDEHLEEGLQARVADPLWMLAKQWQVGEFHGEDAASPVHMRVRAHSFPVVSFRNDSAGAGAPIEKADRGVPLETRVEAERVLDGPAAFRLAAEAGAQFLRRLDAAGLGSLRRVFRGRFPLTLPTRDRDGLPDRIQRRIDLIERRGIDGRRLMRARARDLRGLVTRPQLRRLREVLRSWRAEYRDRFVEPSPGGETWKEDRLEYGFSIAASAGQGEVVLEAPEYSGGHLDWYGFDITTRDASTHGLSASSPRTQEFELLPSPLLFPGMPVSRWWEFEEGSVYFGGIESGPADLARLMLVEYATVYGDDWFLVPIRLPVGTINRVAEIVVVDTFGRFHTTLSSAVYDQRELGTEGVRPWAFFELTGDESAQRDRTPWLFLAPSLAGSLNGRPVERVVFVRDEAANLAWGIEERFETPTGRPLPRRQQWTPSSGSEPQAPESNDPAEDGWRYRLQTSVPPHWIPLIPQRLGESGQMKLQRGRLLAWEELDQGTVGAQGRLMDPRRALWLHEEEIPRGGIEVTRGWQLARGMDGSLRVWMARRKRPGRGERGSGLRFDQVER